MSRRVQLYVGFICLLGAAAVLGAAKAVRLADIQAAWLFVILSCLGSAARVSLRPLARNANSSARGASMSVGFAFTFAAILYAGVPVGVLTAALTGLVTPLVRRRPSPRYQTIFNSASLALSAWAAGNLYFLMAQESPSAAPGAAPQTHLLAVMVATYIYYLVSTWSVATVVALVRTVSPLSTWIETFLWTAPGYFIGSAAAVVSVAYYGHYGFWVFAVTIPAILATHRSYRAYLDRVQETQERYDEVQRLYQESLQLVSQSEKMASIGTLAGGIAHEINNPLMVILGRTELVLSDLPEDHPCVRDLQVIEEETRRIAGIVGELLRFSRRDSSREMLPVDLNEVTKRSLHLLQYQLRVDNVSIETELEPGLPAVAGNGGRLQQVMTNLCC
ncbi:MAG: hypothetical protein LC772_01485 [Chloroflexi bacterium]|nr:hypothetical protein [Chloroflexota bacterium]